MCCHKPHHKMSSCGCFPRRFVSSAEEKERLERYQEQLKKELAGVEEKIKEMG